jgi:hypothetical protein
MRGSLPPTEIERIEAPTRDVFEREYGDRNRPVIITGFVDGWRAASAWSPDYFREVAGDSVVSARFDAGGDHMNYYTPSGGQSRDMTFGELLDGLTAESPDTRHYLSQYAVRAVSPKLLDDFDFSRYLDDALSVFFIGRRSYSPNHHHGNAEAALCQIAGTKTVKLYPPDQSSCMYPYPWYSPLMNFSRVDDRNPDLARFPAFARAHPLVVDVHPGEMLYIPVHWWHSVSGPDELAVSVTLFWGSKRARYHMPFPTLQVWAHAYLSPFSIKGKLAKLFGRTRAKQPVGY